MADFNFFFFRKGDADGRYRCFGYYFFSPCHFAALLHSPFLISKGIWYLWEEQL